MKKKYNVGIIGCGLIGHKRALSLGEKGKLIGCYDINPIKSENFSKEFEIKKFKNLDLLINSKDIDIVIIATLHDSLSTITKKCLEAKKYVLVEKPAGKNLQDVIGVIQKYPKYKKFVKVGFNHRYHKAVIKALSLFKDGEIGNVMYIRARYGHGG